MGYPLQGTGEYSEVQLDGCKYNQMGKIQCKYLEIGLGG